MKLSFRWFGHNDPIPLNYIRQIPNMHSVVSAVYSVAVGEPWSNEDILSLKNAANANGLELDVIESVPVHEDIKAGKPTREKYIENYIKNIRALANAGVKCICYNFMPVFDWLRTELAHKNEDGSNSLSYNSDDFARLNPQNLSLPGWDESYSKEELKELLSFYQGLGREKLFENMIYFLQRVIPACEECGVVMAVHPDDPPWDVFSIPRIISSEQDLDRLFTKIPSKANGLAFCTGSFGAGRKNDLAKMALKYAGQGRIHFAHLRNIKWGKDDSFTECAHPCGSLDMAAIVTALVRGGFDGYVRPDHGRNIFGENGKPGYGLYDRALGATYINGLFEMAHKLLKENN